MPPRQKEESVKKGDKVQAKWSGSSIYYPAIVMELEGKQCKVQYEDGTIHSIKLTDVKPATGKSDSASGTKSNRTRSRSRSAGRKPRSRSRSPGRPPGRPKSKTTTTTTVKTEKKSTKIEKKNNALLPERLLTDVTDSPKRDRTPTSRKELAESSKKETIASSEKEQLSVSKREPIGSSRKEQSSASRVTKSNSSSETVIYSDVVVQEKVTVTSNTEPSAANLRSSARIAALQTTRVATRTPDSVLERQKLSYSSRNRKAKYSDDEESEEEEEEEREEVKAEPKGFSYLSFIGVAFKIVVLPMVPLYFALVCSRRDCKVLDVPHFYSKPEDLWNAVKYPLLACFAFHLCLAILSKLPIGKQIPGFPFGGKGTIKKYRLNGFYILLFSIAVFGGLAYYKLYMNWGYDKIKPIVITSVIYTFIWSFILHLQGLLKHKDPEEGNRNIESGFLGNFFYGHEINPTLYFNEDVKSRFIQFGLIGLVLLDLSIFAKVSLMKGTIPVPLALTLGLQTFMVLDYFWREETMLSTAIYTKDGVGYGFLLTVGSVIPATFALQTVFVAQYNKFMTLPHWCAAAIVVLFFCGYYLYVSSSNLKHAFRRNAFSPSLAEIESIPTSKKKRLIVSGLWGSLRHPNYIGFIIMVLAASLPCGISHLLPYTPFFFITIMLILRSFTIETLCNEKYGPAWVNYTERVRSRFIPFVF